MEEATEPVTDVVEPVLEDVIEEVVEPTIEVVVEVVDEVIEGAGDPITPVAPAPPIEGPMASRGAGPRDPAVGHAGDSGDAAGSAGPIGPMEPGSGPDVDGGSTIVNGVVVVSEDPSSALPSARTPSMGAIAPNVTFAVGRLSDRLAGTLFTTGTAAIAFPLLLAASSSRRSCSSRAGSIAATPGPVRARPGPAAAVLRFELAMPAREERGGPHTGELVSLTERARALGAARFGFVVVAVRSRSSRRTNSPPRAPS